MLWVDYKSLPSQFLNIKQQEQKNQHGLSLQFLTSLIQRPGYPDRLVPVMLHPNLPYWHTSMAYLILVSLIFIFCHSFLGWHKGHFLGEIFLEHAVNLCVIFCSITLFYCLQNN